MSTEFLTWLSTYLIIIICELGDKTQLAVLLLTGNNPHKRWTVLAGSCLALTLCVIIEVTLGLTLSRYIGPSLINKIAGGVFILLGLIMLGKCLAIDKAIPKAINRNIQVKEQDVIKAEIDL